MNILVIDLILIGYDKKIAKRNIYAVWKRRWQLKQNDINKTCKF